MKTAPARNAVPSWRSDDALRPESSAKTSAPANEASAKTAALNAALWGCERFLTPWAAAAAIAGIIAAPGPKLNPTARKPIPETAIEPRP